MMIDWLKGSQTPVGYGDFVWVADIRRRVMFQQGDARCKIKALTLFHLGDLGDLGPPDVRSTGGTQIRI